MRLERCYRYPAIPGLVERIKRISTAQNPARRSQPGFKWPSQIGGALMQRDEATAGFACARKMEQESQSQAYTAFGGSQVNKQRGWQCRWHEEPRGRQVGEIVSAAVFQRRRITDNSREAQPWMASVQALPIQTQSAQS